MDKLKEVPSRPDTEDQGGLAEVAEEGGGTFLKLGCQNRELRCVSCYRNSLLTPEHSSLAAEEGTRPLPRFTPLLTPSLPGAFLMGPMEQLQRTFEPWV